MYEPVPERRIPWKFTGVRPVNHPQRRLACLARVVERWGEFVKVCGTVDGVAGFLGGLEHEYWSYHYTLSSRRSERALALIGADRIRDFQVNHLVPERLVAGDEGAWDFYQKLPAPVISDRVDKASVRLFGSGVENRERAKKFLRKAWQHQALLQVYEDFCLRDVSDCEDCPFPEQLGQWRSL